jgi:hypothetical protein
LFAFVCVCFWLVGWLVGWLVVFSEYSQWVI